jgi:hypothetical protein
VLRCGVVNPPEGRWPPSGYFRTARHHRGP